MTNALTAFIREQMDARGMKNADVERASGLSKQLVSKLANDHRELLTRPPERATLEGLAKAFNIPLPILVSKTVEAMGLATESGDFVYELGQATDEELVNELARRLEMRRGTPRITASMGSGKSSTLVALSRGDLDKLASAARPGQPADAAVEQRVDDDIHASQDHDPADVQGR